MDVDYKIRALMTIEPCLLEVSCSEMGYEFSAVLPTGLIYSVPGMLLSTYDGELPDLLKESQPDKKLLREFLLSDEWDVVGWYDIESSTIDSIYESIFDISTMTLKEKFSHALSREQLSELSEIQLNMLKNRLALRIEKVGETNITPDEIIGIYELITEYLMPTYLEKRIR